MGQHMTQTDIIKAVTTPSTAVPLSTTENWVDGLWLFMKRTAGDNSGNVFIGGSALDQGVAEGAEFIPGAYWEHPLSFVKDQSFNLADIYIDADVAADGVVGVYWK